jgi:Na+-transporting methylmalonyl-CoA/oxaloacetate decarboxylase gamma subunit
MSLVAVVLVLSLLVLLVVSLLAVIRRDGYGTVPPPRSHPSWDDATTLPTSRLV